MYPVLDMVPPLLLKRRDHQLKRAKRRRDMYQSFYPIVIAEGGQDLATHQPDLTHPCALGQHAPAPPPPVAMPGGPDTGQETRELESVDDESI
jgi:hypothetical protein